MTSKRHLIGYGVAAIIGASAVAWGQDGRSPIANLRGRTDADGNLYVTLPSAIQTEGVILNTPSVIVENLGPTDSSTYAVDAEYIVTTASTNAGTGKASAGNFYGVVRAINTTTTIAYLRLYDLAANPTCSSATGFIESIPIPPAAAAGGAGGIAVPEILPTQYATGIAYCVTGGGTSTDNTSAPAGIYIKFVYK